MNARARRGAAAQKKETLREGGAAVAARETEGDTVPGRLSPVCGSFRLFAKAERALAHKGPSLSHLPTMAPLTFPPAEEPVQTLVGLQLPAPAIVLIAVAAYLLAMLLLILLRQCLLAQGMCTDCCTWDKAGNLGVCECCFTCAESCDCRVPSVAHCLDTCCPRSSGCDCESCAGCQFCPLCDCACAYQPPDCESLNCICFEVKLR